MILLSISSKKNTRVFSNKNKRIDGKVINDYKVACTIIAILQTFLKITTKDEILKCLDVAENITRGE